MAPAMEGLTSRGLVVLGNNLPVATIDLADFEDDLGPLSVEVRAPVAIQAKAGTCTFQMLENRASLDWKEPIPDDARERMAKAMRTYANDYAGKKAPTAMGHNLQGELRSEIPARQLLRSFLNTERIDPILMSDSPQGAALTLFFKRGRETRAQLILAASMEDEMTLTYSFNFHFDLADPDAPTFEEALQEWEKSERFAEESLDALVGLMEEGGS